MGLLDYSPLIRRWRLREGNRPSWKGIFIPASRSFYYETLGKTLEIVHHSTHLNYWSLIVIGTLVARTTITFPLSIYQRVCLIRWKTMVLPQMTQWKTQQGPLFVNNCRENHLPYSVYKEKWKAHVNEKFRTLIREHHCHPWKILLLPIIQLPLFITLSLTLRHVLHNCPTMTEGGILWFKDLATIDPTLLFPIMVATSHWLNVEIHASYETSKKSNDSASLVHRWGLGVGRFLSLIMVPVTCCVPSGIAIYWLTSSLFSVIQNVLLHWVLMKRLQLQLGTAFGTVSSKIHETGPALKNTE
jgi:mitochondrial inner membrane protein COX18